MKKFFSVLLAVGMHVAAYSQQAKMLTHIEGGILSYASLSEKIGYSFKGVGTWPLNPTVSMGVGLGYEKFFLKEQDVASLQGIPLFAQGKYILTPDRGKSLYSALDAGYSFNLDKTEDNEKIKGGILLAPQLGYLWKLSNERDYFTIAIGYKYQQFKKDISPMNGGEYGGFADITYNLHRLSLMVGISF